MIYSKKLDCKHFQKIEVLQLLIVFQLYNMLYISIVYYLNLYYVDNTAERLK